MKLAAIRYGRLLLGFIALAGIVAFVFQATARVNECELTFSDNFDGPQLDTTRWNVEYPSGRTEKQFYAPDAFELSNGRLRIKADVRPQQGYAYTSGMITTQHTFAQQYGYFEIRAQIPHGQGLWPAFWLLHTGPLPWTEVDVFEILGHDTHKVYMSNHWRDAASQHQALTQSFTGSDLAEGFHTFAVDWTPGKLDWYIDGVKRAEATQHVPAEPMFILVNLAVGGQWHGYPDATTRFPAYLDIDYIHVYAPGCQPPGLTKLINVRPS